MWFSQLRPSIRPAWLVSKEFIMVLIMKIVESLNLVNVFHGFMLKSVRCSMFKTSKIKVIRLYRYRQFQGRICWCGGVLLISLTYNAAVAAF